MFTYKTVNNNVLINKHKSTYTNNKITIKPNIKTSWMLLFCFGIHQFLSTCYAISSYCNKSVTYASQKSICSIAVGLLLENKQ